MTPQEAKQFFEEQKAQGQTEDEILGTLYAMFVDDSINLDQLEALVNALGYELTEEFKNMSPEDQKTKGWAEEEEKAPEAVEKQEEETPANAPKEEEAPKEEPKEEAPAAAPKEEEDDEKEKAKQLFGLNK